MVDPGTVEAWLEVCCPGGGNPDHFPWAGVDALPEEKYALWNLLIPAAVLLPMERGEPGARLEVGTWRWTPP